ncbi:MAG TPA: hypothetical protein DD490_07105 [Acidobacteria bacterium]|nr:hypothetical protein [Acidobacteriota bacterium]
MAENPKFAPCGESVQHAFDRQADQLGLRVEPEGDAARLRTIGIAIACVNRIVDVEMAKEAPAGFVTKTAAPAAASSDADIQQVITGYETLAPEDFVRQWRNYATDPHVGIGWGWLAPINTEVVDRWLERPELQEVLRAFPPYSPRRITVSDLRIVYIGPSRAAATYRVEEEHTNGRISGGNTVAVLMKIEGGGWKIVAASKGGRELLAGDAGDRPE